MQIELIGCTSAGKSTFSRKLVTGVGQQADAVQTSYDYVLARFGLSQVAPHLLRMAVLNLLALGSAFVTYAKEPRLLLFMLRLLRDLPAAVSWRERLKIARITSRNLGIHTLATAAPKDQQILADEGNVQVVHYLFVHLAQAPDLDVIDRYLAQIPLPDLVVYYRQPQEVLLERTLRRGHKRIRKHTTTNVERFIAHAYDAFEHVAQSPALADRLLILDGQTNMVVRHPSGAAARESADRFRQMLTEQAICLRHR